MNEAQKKEIIRKIRVQAAEDLYYSLRKIIGLCDMGIEFDGTPEEELELAYEALKPWLDLDE